MLEALVTHYFSNFVLYVTGSTHNIWACHHIELHMFHVIGLDRAMVACLVPHIELCMLFGLVPVYICILMQISKCFHSFACVQKPLIFSRVQVTSIVNSFQK